MSKKTAGIVALGAGIVMIAVLVALRMDVISFGAPKGAEAKEELDSLGYIGVSKIERRDQGKSGVITWQRQKVPEALALQVPTGWGRELEKAGGRPTREARLIDASGAVLRRWSADYPPDSEKVRDRRRRGRRGWATAKFGPDGDLYAVHSGMGLLRLDWDSNLVWGRPEFYHHDLTFDDKGNVLALIDAERRVDVDGETVVLLDHGITSVSADGKLLDVLWLYDLVKDQPEFAASLQRHRNNGKRWKATAPPSRDFASDASAFFTEQHGSTRRGLDAVHANTIDIASADGPQWSRGDWIVCLREMDVIVVIDPSRKALRWSWGAGVLDRPHDPQLLDNGNILVFDNGTHRGWSRVIEVDPKTQEIVWQYGEEGKDRFFSKIRGQATQLTNGHIFVVSSQKGRALQMTREREIVWEFFSPDILPGGYRVPMRMLRLDGPVLARVKSRCIETNGCAGWPKAHP